MKLIKTFTTTTASILLSTTLISTVASASTWHQGTPKKLDSSWVSKKHFVRGDYESTNVRFSNDEFNYWLLGGSTPGRLIKTSYKYVGNGKYKVRGTVSSQGQTYGKKTITVKLNGNKINLYLNDPYVKDKSKNVFYQAPTMIKTSKNKVSADGTWGGK
ncbi:hypothetical protein ACYATP_00170 [Lactobacillaceae bacterium Melli_B4]